MQKIKVLVKLALFAIRDVNTGFLAKPVFGCWKPVLNRISVSLAFIEMYNLN